MAKKKNRNCIYCGQFKGRLFHSCPQKKRAKKRPERFDGSNVFAEQYDVSSVTSDPAYSDAYKAYREKAEAGEGGLVSYRVYDQNNNPIGWYKTEHAAQMAAIGVGGWVREYSGRPKTEDQSLAGRVFNPKPGFAPTDGNDWDVPKRTEYERPDVKYKAYDAQGKLIGTFEEEYEAMEKAREKKGSVEKYALKHAYRYERPKEHMSFLERLRDNGSPYERVSKKK